MLAVEAAMQVKTPGFAFRIDGSGTRLTCRVERRSFNVVETLRGSRALITVVRSLAPVLVRGGVRLDIRAGRTSLARIGAGITSNALANLLRLPATHLGP